MMGLAAVSVFTGAMALAVAAIWSTVAPQWRRIAALAAGRIEQPFQPLADLAQAERHIALRGWATAPVAVRTPRHRLRAA